MSVSIKSVEVDGLPATVVGIGFTCKANPLVIANHLSGVPLYDVSLLYETAALIGLFKSYESRLNVNTLSEMVGKISPPKLQVHNGEAIISVTTSNSAAKVRKIINYFVSSINNSKIISGCRVVLRSVNEPYNAAYAAGAINDLLTGISKGIDVVIFSRKNLKAAIGAIENAKIVKIPDAEKPMIKKAIVDEFVGSVVTVGKPFETFLVKEYLFAMLKTKIINANGKLFIKMSDKMIEPALTKESAINKFTLALTKDEKRKVFTVVKGVQSADLPLSAIKTSISESDVKSALAKAKLK